MEPHTRELMVVVDYKSDTVIGEKIIHVPFRVIRVGNISLIGEQV
jgi:hypothetical protein